jgi:hypothetical protein
MASGTVLPPPINITGTQQRGLAPLAVPPTTLLRVIPGMAWTKHTWVDWLNHVASRHSGGGILSPRIGKDTAPQIYVTDEPSLDGYLDRLGIFIFCI